MHIDMSESGERPKPSEEFYAAIGQFVLAWSDLEFCLDLLFLKIRLMHDEANRPGKQPHQFSDKIKCIRSLVRDLELPGSTHRAAINDLLDKIEGYAETRHDYVHGAVINHHIERRIMTATLARLLQPSKKPRRTPVSVTAAEIKETANCIRRFGDGVFNIVQKL